jgi:hypothetical protein
LSENLTAALDGLKSQDSDFLLFSSRRDFNLVNEALLRIQLVNDEITRVSKIKNAGGLDPLPTAPENVAALGLDYQLGVGVASRFTQAYSAVNPLDPESGIRGTLADSRKLAATLIPNFYDVYASNFPSAVSNSQLHYGVSVGVGVEDQPLWRGNYFADVFSATRASNWDVKLLVDNFSQNDFGDTHSLVLIVDSLSVQHAFAKLDPSYDLNRVAFNRLLLNAAFDAPAAERNTQGIADGRALDNLVNGLSKLCGLDVPPLVGDIHGNTWFDPASRAALHNRLALIADSGVFKCPSLDLI